MLTADEIAVLVEQAKGSQTQLQGGNSTVTRIDWHGRSVALKDYSARADARVRLDREWQALQLLWESGLRIAPEPLGCAPGLGVGVQQWLPGHAAVANGATQIFMHESLRALHALSRASGSDYKGRAADAIDEMDEMRGQVQGRIDSLDRAQAAELVSPLVTVRNAFDFLVTAADQGSVPVPTLSPSDFGPHNIMTDAESGRRWIIDLEFFGWDDAHKLVCDTLVHPLVQWQHLDIAAFVHEVTHIYGLDEARLQLLLPWCSLKWATIVLARAERELRSGDAQAAQRALVTAAGFTRRAIESEAGRRDSIPLIAILLQESSA